MLARDKETKKAKERETKPEDKKGEKEGGGQPRRKGLVVQLSDALNFILQGFQKNPQSLRPRD